MKIKDKLVERRKYIRLKTPIPLTYVVQGNSTIYNSVTKDISADGLRFETDSRDLKESAILELKIGIGNGNNPVHAKGRVIWQRRVSLEDNAPHDVGVELIEIEEDNKNTFLKFLCDLIYNLPKES